MSRKRETMTAVILVHDIMSVRPMITNANNILRVREEGDVAGWLKYDFNLRSMYC